VARGARSCVLECVPRLLGFSISTSTAINRAVLQQTGCRNGIAA
jgi:hypothetical protein